MGTQPRSCNVVVGLIPEEPRTIDVSATGRKCPQLALTPSALEERFLALCESAKLPLPEVNAKVEGLMVDFLGRGHRVIVEVDGPAAHATRFQRERDHYRDLKLRASGHTVRRYTWLQLTAQSHAVENDLHTTLTPLAPSA